MRWAISSVSVFTAILTFCKAVCKILCKMSRERKSEEEAEAIGAMLRSLREQQGLTLQQLQDKTGVNVGQVWRFEAGQFVFVTRNLQKVLNFLQEGSAPLSRHPHLLQRFAELLERSPRHQTAAVALIGALEVLQ